MLTGPSELYGDFISHCQCSTRGAKGTEPPTTIVGGEAPSSTF